MIPPLGEPQLAVLDRLDGLLLSGSPSNVHPDHYAGGDCRTPDLHDLERDATTLRLIPEAVRARHPRAGDLPRHPGAERGARRHAVPGRCTTEPGRFDHRGQGDDIEARYAPRHLVTLSGGLARIVGLDDDPGELAARQAIDQVAPGLVVEALAPDGTIEAVRLCAGGACSGRTRGWSGVQWHPEWRYADDTASLAIFRAFGEACRAYQAGLRKAA